MSAFRNVLVAATLILLPGAASAAEPLKVVATFSILGDLVGNVGGPDVQVTTLVGPDGDAHVFEPSPADARRVAEADLVVVNGLGFEGWLDRLVEASGFSGRVIVASAGVDALAMGEEHSHGDEHAHEHADGAEAHAGEHEHDAHEEEHAGDHHHHGDVDPHAWQSVENAQVYVANIAAALCDADAEHCADFKTRAAAYDSELATLDASMKTGFAALPAEKRTVITSHDAFGYFSHAYGVRFLAPQGISTEGEASAAAIASLIGQIRNEGVTALFVENISDPRLIEQIARETGVRPGGALYSDALSAADGPAPTYAAMMRYNADRLLAAMQGS